MATLTPRPSRLRADDIFFPAMALLLLIVVVVGFAQSYFRPGMVLAKLPNALVHIHGALYVSWIFLLVLQNALVAARKVKWHVRLGVVGVILPPLMVMLGPALNRWPFPDAIRLSGTIAVYLVPPLLIVVYDLWSRRRVHRTTAIAYALIAVAILTMVPVASMGFWTQCAAWIRHA